jgi:hypothetical protein
MFAADEGHTSIVEMLLTRSDIDINIVDEVR